MRALGRQSAYANMAISDIRQRCGMRTDHRLSDTAPNRQPPNQTGWLLRLSRAALARPERSARGLLPACQRERPTTRAAALPCAIHSHRFWLLRYSSPTMRVAICAPSSTNIYGPCLVSHILGFCSAAVQLLQGMPRATRVLVRPVGSASFRPLRPALASAIYRHVAKLPLAAATECTRKGTNQEQWG